MTPLQRAIELLRLVDAQAGTAADKERFALLPSPTAPAVHFTRRKGGPSICGALSGSTIEHAHETTCSHCLRTLVAELRAATQATPPLPPGWVYKAVVHAPDAPDAPAAVVVHDLRDTGAKIRCGAKRPAATATDVEEITCVDCLRSRLALKPRPTSPPVVHFGSAPCARTPGANRTGLVDKATCTICLIAEIAYQREQSSLLRAAACDARARLADILDADV